MQVCIGCNRSSYPGVFFKGLGKMNKQQAQGCFPLEGGNQTLKKGKNERGANARMRDVGVGERRLSNKPDIKGY